MLISCVRACAWRVPLCVWHLLHLQAMMLELGVVELDMMQPFIKQFRLLDSNGNARLGRDDLENTRDKSLAELQRDSVRRMKRQMSMSVGDRMGLSLAVDMTA